MKGVGKKLGLILGIIASCVIIGGAVKTGVEKLKDADEAAPAETAAVCVVDL